MTAHLLARSLASVLRAHVDVINARLTEFRHAVSADCTALSWIEAEENTIRTLPNGLPELSGFETTPAMPGRTVCHYPLLNQRTLALASVKDAPPGFVPCNFMIAEGFQGYLASPVTGVVPKIRLLICAMTSEPRTWSVSDIELVEDAAKSISLVLQSNAALLGQKIH